MAQLQIFILKCTERKNNYILNIKAPTTIVMIPATLITVNCSFKNNTDNINVIIGYIDINMTEAPVVLQPFKEE